MSAKTLNRNERTTGPWDGPHNQERKEVMSAKTLDRDEQTTGPWDGPHNQERKEVMKTKEQDYVAEKAAYEEVKAMLLSFALERRPRLRLEARHAADTVLATLPRIDPYRDRLAALPGDEIEAIGLLSKLAKALQWIEAGHGKEPGHALRELAEEGFEHRSMLDEAARPLASKGLVGVDRLDAIGNSRGYRNLAADLLAFARLYGDAWPKVDGKTSVTDDDVKRSKDLYDRLMKSLLARQGAPPDDGAEPAPSQLRERALWLLRERYREVRVGLSYLCGSESKAARIMPSLRRPPRKRAVAEAEQTAAAGSEATVPATTGAEVSAEVSAEPPASAGGQPPVVEPAPVGTAAGSEHAEAVETEPAAETSTGERGPASTAPAVPGSSNGDAGRPSVVPC